MNRLYMSKPEFLERQMWLPFEDAVGMALQAVSEVKARAWTWFKGWKKTLWRVAWKKPVNLALWLPFINEGVRP
ncbi:MAG: hypothetical protein H6935_15185 [Thiobacillus sp.]|nr:hypothetical protein [Thiobacillus sp.]